MNQSPETVANPIRILIVDDERRNRELLEVMLRPEGYQFLSAANGEEALAIVASEAPDLVLLDVMMPEMDGYEVAGRIKRTPSSKNIPVILITALDDRYAKMVGLTAGAEEFLTKPVDRAELCARVRNLLRLKAYGDYHDKYSRLLEEEVSSRTADLSRSERLYRDTFDAAPVGIVHVGRDGRWLEVNRRLCELLGYSLEELRSDPVRELMRLVEVPGEAESFQQMSAGTLDHYTIDEKVFRRRDGGLVWARVNTSVHRDAAGKPRNFVTVVEDITERRALEAEVRQTTKMDAIGRLAAGVAHDFNNLLTVILGLAELMKTDMLETSEQGKDLDEIISAATRARGLTKQMLVFSRQQELHPAPLDVNALVRDMAGMLARLIGDDVKIELALTSDLSAALVDRGQLEQVVMNLVINARDAMPGGGCVTIETADVELEGTPLRPDAAAAGSYVMMAVSDTGSGMSKETQQRLFEPFYTTKGPGNGTGLGLSTIYGIVKQSNGHIDVYSELGHGTVFKVYLPRAGNGAAVSDPPPTIDASTESVTETVLLVEDEIGIRQLSRRILTNAGYSVMEAVDANDAERLFSAHAGDIDLVLTDMIMPGRSGIELVQSLREQTPTLRTLVMSGYTEQVAMNRAEAAPDTPFLQKPFTSVELLRQVREALR